MLILAKELNGALLYSVHLRTLDVAIHTHMPLHWDFSLTTNSARRRRAPSLLAKTRNFSGKQALLLLKRPSHCLNHRTEPVSVKVSTSQAHYSLARGCTNDLDSLRRDNRRRYIIAPG